MTKRILIAGCGKLGSAVGLKLAELGHEVVGLRRRAQLEEQGFNYRQADLTQPQTLEQLPADFDLVIIIVTPSDYSDAGYHAIYVDGVGNLLTHFARRNASPQLIYVSSTRVYGQQQAEWIDEVSETAPTDEKGRILLNAEQQVLAFGEQKNTVVRFSGIYDSGSQFMQRQAAQGKPIQFNPPSFTNRVHREDCIGSLVFLAEKALSHPPLASHYLVTDDEPASKWEVVNWLAQQAGLTSPDKEICDTQVDQGRRCSNQRIKEEGYCFKYSNYRDGYKA